MSSSKGTTRRVRAIRHKSNGTRDDKSEKPSTVAVHVGKTLLSVKGPATGTLFKPPCTQICFLRPAMHVSYECIHSYKTALCSPRAVVSSFTLRAPKWQNSCPHARTHAVSGTTGSQKRSQCNYILSQIARQNLVSGAATQSHDP